MALTLGPHWEQRRGRNGDWRAGWPVVLALVLLSAAPAFGASDPSQAIVCKTTQIAGAPRPGSVPANLLAPVISANGNRIAFAGAGPGHGIFLFDVPSATLTQLAAGDAVDPSSLALGINRDGTRIAFSSSIDLTGENADRNPEIFLMGVASGTFTQITDTIAASNVTPAMNDDGSRVAFRSTADLAGQNADGNEEIFLFDIATGVFTQITRTQAAGTVGQPAISSTGTRVVFDATEDLTGMNPDGNAEIFLFDTVTATLTQITRTVAGTNTRAVVDGEGTRIVFESTADLIGNNPDLNGEVFVYDTRSGTFTQVTETVGGTSAPQSINAAGTLVALISSAGPTGGNPEGNDGLFLFDSTAGTFTSVARTVEGVATSAAVIGDVGIRIAFVSDQDLTGRNPDGNSAIFLSDCDRVNDLLSLQALPETFLTTPDPTGCPLGFAGKFSFVGQLSSLASSPALTDLQVQVQTLTNGNVLQDADDGPAGVGATLTVPQGDDYSDGVLDPGEQADVLFVICVRDLSPFQFVTEMRANLP